METMINKWETTDLTTTVPFDQAKIDAMFDEIAKPMNFSSGWVCTLTIECGTFICACR